MKIYLLFILFNFSLAQQGFEEFMNNVMQQSQLKNNNLNRNLLDIKSAKEYVQNLLPKGLNILITKENIKQYEDIRIQLTEKLSELNEFTQSYDYIKQMAHDLQQIINYFFYDKDKQYIMLALLPSEKDKQKFLKHFELYRKKFKECVLDIRLNLFTEEAIEECIGKDFSKVNNAFDFQLFQYRANKEIAMRKMFIKYCYEEEGADPMDCDTIEQDMIDFIWVNFNLADNFRENRLKYEGMNGKISQQIYEHLLSILVQYSEKHEKVYLFFEEIYEGFKAKLKQDIGNQEKVILEYQAPIKITKPQQYIDTKIDIKQTFEDDDNYVNIDQLPSLKLSHRSELFSNDKNRAIEQFMREHPDYDERHYPFKELQGPTITIH